jgi:DNA-binding XRE family transcriptional regulator
MENKIKHYRAKRGLTQTQLAERADTSQQQIQRLETGKIAARLELAIRLAKALGVPMATLFPGSARALAAMRKERAGEPGYLPADKTYGRVAATGVEADSRYWIFRVQLRGQVDVLDFRVEPDEKRRLFGAVQSESGGDEALSFVVFDTKDARIGLNLAHCLYCHFIYEAWEMGSSDGNDGDDEEAGGVQAYFADLLTPVRFSADVDRGRPGDEDDVGCFRTIFFYLDTNVERDQRLYFEDADGEDVFIRATDLALLKVPLWVVDPDFLLIDGEDEEHIADV